MTYKPMHLRQFLQLAGAAVIASCSTSSQPPKPAPQSFASLPETHQEVYDALFRHLITGWTGSEFKFKRWYLSLLAADAPQDLLDRYRAEGMNVFPASSYQDGRGVALYIHSIASLTPSHAELIADCVFGPVGAVNGTYHLVYKQGRWVVSSFKIGACA